MAVRFTPQSDKTSEVRFSQKKSDNRTAQQRAKDIFKDSAKVNAPLKYDQTKGSRDQSDWLMRAANPFNVAGDLLKGAAKTTLAGGLNLAINTGDAIDAAGRTIVGAVTGKEDKPRQNSIRDAMVGTSQAIDSSEYLKATVLPQWAADLGGSLVPYGFASAAAIKGAGKLASYSPYFQKTIGAILGIAGESGLAAGTASPENRVVAGGGTAVIMTALYGISPAFRTIANPIMRNISENQTLKFLLPNATKDTKIAIERFGGVKQFLEEYSDLALKPGGYNKMLPQIDNQMRQISGELDNVIERSGFGGNNVDLSDINKGLSSLKVQQILKGSEEGIEAVTKNFVRVSEEFNTRLQMMGIDPTYATVKDAQALKRAYSSVYEGLATDEAPKATKAALKYIHDTLLTKVDDATNGATKPLNRKLQTLYIAKESMERQLEKQVYNVNDNVLSIFTAFGGLGASLAGLPVVGATAGAYAVARLALKNPTVRSAFAESLKKGSKFFNSLANATDPNIISSKILKFAEKNKELSGAISSAMQSADDKTPQGIAKYFDDVIKKVEKGDIKIPNYPKMDKRYAKENVRGPQYSSNEGLGFTMGEPQKLLEAPTYSNKQLFRDKVLN